MSCSKNTAKYVAVLETGQREPRTQLQPGREEEGWRRGGAEEETEGQAAIFNLGSEVSGTWPRHFSKRMILLPSVSKSHNLLNMHQQIACTKKCPCIFFHHKGLKKCNSVKPGPKRYGKEN